MRWLCTQAVAAGLGSRAIRELTRQVKSIIDHAHEHAPSVPWMERMEHHGEHLPEGMVWSREKTRLGAEGRACRRLTPPIAVELEDALDSLSALDAMCYVGPASASSAALARLRVYGRAGLPQREAARAQRVAGDETLSSAPMLRGDRTMESQTDGALLATVNRRKKSGPSNSRGLLAAEALLRRAG